MNYKIKITSENQAIVKRIADENGMNPHDFKFDSGFYLYEIQNNKFVYLGTIQKGEEETILTTDQFIELFDKKETEMDRIANVLARVNKPTQETELDKWLRETKAKNLSYKELHDIINDYRTCPRDIYEQIEKQYKCNYTNIVSTLYDKWNNLTEESPKVETEKRKIIGYKAPFDFVWGGVKKGDIAIRDEFQPYVYNVGISARIAMEIVETWEPVFEPLPIEPKETDFKTKVIELIEKNINDKQQKLEFVINKNNLIYEAVLECIVAIQKDLLNQIKEL